MLLMRSLRVWPTKQSRTHSAVVCLRSAVTHGNFPASTNCSFTPCKLRVSHQFVSSQSASLCHRIPSLVCYSRHTYCTIAAGSSSSEYPELTCSGCGSVIQAVDPSLPGFIPLEKSAALQRKLSEMKNGSSGIDDVKSNDSPGEETGSWKHSSPLPICKRCFSLKHYNTALNITLKADDYLRHLAHLKEKKALILLMIDVTDFPGSLLPNLNTLVPANNPIMIVANKVDLLPVEVKQGFKRLESAITKECLKSSLAGCRIERVHFVSAKTGAGVKELTNSIVRSWGNRGDVYLLGCTNVGKSSLFNHLLVALCGALPGELDTDSNIDAPMATISQWPGTTLGLLRFPIMSMGKRRRRLAQSQRGSHTEEAKQIQWGFIEEEENLAFDEKSLALRHSQSLARDAMMVEDPLSEVGLREKPLTPRVSRHHAPPQNRFWLHDTPGAINDAQLINLLTTKELKLALPKKSLKPRTFILKPGQCILIGGLARIDYHDGPVSAYFTVFAASYLPIHATKIAKADDIYARNLGTHLLKIPCGDKDRLEQFPKLKSEELSITGVGWHASAADVILSSAGWVGITMGQGKTVVLRAYTPNGRGVFLRTPALFQSAVNKKGKRSKKGNRAAFLG